MGYRPDGVPNVDRTWIFFHTDPTSSYIQSVEYSKINANEAFGVMRFSSAYVVSRVYTNLSTNIHKGAFHEDLIKAHVGSSS